MAAGVAMRSSSSSKMEVLGGGRRRKRWSCIIEKRGERTSSGRHGPFLIGFSIESSLMSLSRFRHCNEGDSDGSTKVDA